MYFIDYQSYKGGINNLCVVFDLNGNRSTSIKGKEKAISNYKRMIKRMG